MRRFPALKTFQSSAVHRLAQLNSTGTAFGSWTRRQPYLQPIAKVWTRLLDAFCASIEPLVGRLAPDRRLIAVVGSNDALTFYRATRGGIEAVSDPASPTKGSARGRARRSVELRLRPDQVLQRRLTFPAASREFLAPIIEHRLDRLTPWQQDKVMHGFEIAGDRDQAETLTVTVLLTSSEIVAKPLKALADLGLSPTAIGAESDTLGEPVRIDLRRGGVGRNSHRMQRAVGRLWLSGVGVLTVVVTASLVWVSTAESRRAESERHLVKARRLIREATGGDSESREQVLIGEKQPGKSVMLLIDKLATVLPAHTYLREIAVTPEQVRLNGTSGDAPALIALLAQATLLNVHFTAPVTRGGDGRDGFEITADRSAPKAEVP